MVTREQYLEYISTYHPSYNGKVLRSLNWCFKPIVLENGYIYFIKREHRPGIDVNFYAKYEDNCIKIRVEYNYFELYDEINVVQFCLYDYKKNNYESKTMDNHVVNFMADEEILTFIKQFDEYMLEIKDSPITVEEYKFYLKHIINNPELIKPHSSENCNFSIKVFYEEESIFIRFDYYNKLSKEYYKKEFRLFKNRALGDDFHDIHNNVYHEIIQRFDEILCDFQLFIICFM